MIENLFKQDTLITRQDRSKLLGHSSFVLWFTGLSGSGKSTIASKVQEKLHERGMLCYMLDGDNIRLGLNCDLNFTTEGRQENIRRIAEVAKLFVDAGTITLCSFISPLEEERLKARHIIGSEFFIEVYVKCDLEVCEARDVKGLYEKARNGQIKNFTGIDSPYEEPENSDLTVNTTKYSVEECVNLVLQQIDKKINE